MPELLFGLIMCLLTIFGIFFSLFCFAMGFDKNNTSYRLIPLSWSLLSVLIIFSGWKWFSAGDCKYDGYEYIKIERKDNLKFYIYHNRVYNLDKTIDDKEFKIKINKWSNQWVNGIYYHMCPSEKIEFVPIDEKETVEVEVK